VTISNWFLFLRWLSGSECRLSKHRRGGRPRQREEEQQEKRHFSQSGNQHHEGMAVPAPHGKTCLCFPNNIPNHPLTIIIMLFCNE